MSEAPETIWAQDAEPSECNFIGGGWWDETISNTQYPHMVEYRRADIPATDEQAFANEKVKALVALAELADKNLTNLQPKIANGLVHKEWVAVFDGYIDPVIDSARAALAAMKEPGRD